LLLIGFSAQEAPGLRLPTLDFTLFFLTKHPHDRYKISTIQLLNKIKALFDDADYNYILQGDNDE